MEEFKVNIKVFRNTGNDKKSLQNTVQSFIQSTNSGHEIAVVQSIEGDGRPILEEFFDNLGFKLNRNRSAEENLSREDFLERANTMQAIMPELTFRLYNCDKMYDLDKVEALITKVTTRMSQEVKIEKTYFPLPEMHKLCRKLEEEGKHRGYAVFVVHADEPGLVINSDSSAAGYSKLYRTLARLSGDRVLIVIGGDDGYKDQGERDKSVLSRQVLNKVRPQFKAKYLNGMKSFVFSWDESHYPIHEEALEFYLDPQKQGQEFVPGSKTEPPSLALPKGDERKSTPPTEVAHQEKDTPNTTSNKAQAACKSPEFHVLSFHSKKETVSTVENFLSDVSKKLNVACKSSSPYLLPSDFPQHIEKNMPQYVVLVSEMNDFKNIRHIDSWVQLYQDIFKSISITDKTLVFVVCGDPVSKDGSLSSDFIQEQFSSLNSAILPPSKVLVMSWDAKPCSLHQDALLQLLNPHHEKKSRTSEKHDESCPADAEIDPVKGRLRYKARIRYGRVVEVLESDPPGWKPEESMLKQQLERNKDLIRGFLEFWENRKGNITAVVGRPDPLSNVLGFYGKRAFKGLWQEQT
ncbi:uncharacterized protein LOC116304715 [Actinia tenebrosa]|uniref:Uncharacterized protein LOC116304715 n=1 Tax=Actinia tenebrosa TaxID=6105 RepID=A0A6P8IW75_ACTTE|nr:uncharacterized protein LOC116304715 [Actinia tenebrosa]